MLRPATPPPLPHATAPHVPRPTVAPPPSACVFSLHPSSAPRHRSPRIASGELDGSAEMERPVGLRTSFADRDVVPPTSPAPAAGLLDRADHGSRAGELHWWPYCGDSIDGGSREPIDFETTDIRQV